MPELFGEGWKKSEFFDKMLDKHMIVCYFLKRGWIIDISGVLDDMAAADDAMRDAADSIKVC